MSQDAILILISIKFIYSRNLVMVILLVLSDISELELNTHGFLEHTIQLENAQSNSDVTMLTAL